MDDPLDKLDVEKREIPYNPETPENNTDQETIKECEQTVKLPSNIESPDLREGSGRGIEKKDIKIHGRQ